jgi:hypothetical protein
MSKEIMKCVSIRPVLSAFDDSNIWLKKGQIVECLRNERNKYYYVSNNKGDYSVFLDDEFYENFRFLDVDRDEKLNQLL